MAIIALAGAAAGHTTPGAALALTHALAGAAAGHTAPAAALPLTHPLSGAAAGQAHASAAVFLTLNSPRTLVYGQTGAAAGQVGLAYVLRITRARRLEPTLKASRPPVVKGALTPMAGTPDATYNQRVTEVLAYVFDFTDACKDQNGAIVDSVASVAWASTAGISLGTAAIGSTTVKRPVYGGAVGDTYVVICTATLASTVQRTLSVAITVVDNPAT